MYYIWKIRISDRLGMTPRFLLVYLPGGSSHKAKKLCKRTSFEQEDNKLGLEHVELEKLLRYSSGEVK